MKARVGKGKVHPRPRVIGGKAAANWKIRGGASVPGSVAESRASAVRVIENGVDLTPRPLGLASWKDPLPVAEEHVASATSLPSTDDVSTQSVSYEDEEDDESVKRGADDAVTQYLTESPTHTLLHIAGVCVATDFVRKAQIESRNAAYETMLSERASSDRFVVRHCQTINQAHKDQGVTASPPATREVSCQSTSWDIYDATAAQHAGTDSEDNEPHTKVSKSREVMDKTVSVALASHDFLLDVSEAEHQSTLDVPKAAVSSVASSSKPAEPTAATEPQRTVSAEQVLFAQKSNEILASRELAAALARMERCIQQNLFHDKQLLYRDRISADEITELAMRSLAKTGEDPSGAEAAQPNDPQPEARLEVLWAWSAPMTRGRCVTGMAWNHANRDVLAVGYGGKESVSSGLVLFWSLRNPVYPERVLSMGSGCTSLDFSRATPQLLAVGLHDGTVAIYDVRRDDNGVLLAPVVDSENCAGKHMDPVWQVQWVDKGIERGESLVSISTDGRVVEWSMKKGLEETTLMVLKRVGNAEGVISRQASGLSLDFPRDDASIYIAGTEDGLLHRCSCSYNEQYLETYGGHTGPVYKVRCSPFWPPAFLSCSADWTVKLWHQKHNSAIHSFHSVDLSHVVHDVAWSPCSATVFASVAGDGRIEVWDLTQSTLDPVIRHFPKAAAAPPPPPQPVPRDRAPASSDGGDDELASHADLSAPAAPEPDLAAAAAANDEDSDTGGRPPSSTTVLFATKVPVLVVGDMAGGVTCYRMTGLSSDAHRSRDAQIASLKAAMSNHTEPPSAAGVR